MPKLSPVHPGEILTEEFLTPLGLTKHQLAIALGVPASRIDQMAKGKRSISADTAVRLSLYFGNSPEFWLNLQQMHDLSKAKIELNHTIEREIEAYAGA